MAQSASINKTMTIGEGGTAIALRALAVLTIIIAAKAWTPEYAFHAYLFAAASVAAVFAIFNRYFDPLGRARAAGDRRQAELQFRADQVRDRRRDGLGHRRLHGRA